LPFNIAATPDIIGNLKSITVGLTRVIMSCSSARAVKTPSDTPSIDFKISSRLSPLANLNPTRLFHNHMKN
jgi:hypothetical protein